MQLNLANCKSEAAVFAYLHRALICAVLQYEDSSSARAEEKDATIEQMIARCQEWLCFSLPGQADSDERDLEWQEAWEYMKALCRNLMGGSAPVQTKCLATLLYRQIQAVPKQGRGRVSDLLVENLLRRTVEPYIAANVDAGTELFWAAPAKRRKAPARRATPEFTLFVRPAGQGWETKKRGIFGLGIFGETIRCMEQVHDANLKDDAPIERCVRDGGIAVVIYWTDRKALDERRDLRDFFLFEFGLAHEATCHVAVPEDQWQKYADRYWHGWLTFVMLACLHVRAENADLAIEARRARTYGTQMEEEDKATLGEWFGICGSDNTRSENGDVRGWLEAQKCHQGEQRQRVAEAVAKGAYLTGVPPSTAETLVACTRCRLLLASDQSEGSDAIECWFHRKEHRRMAAGFLLCADTCNRLSNFRDAACFSAVRKQVHGLVWGSTSVPERGKNADTSPQG